MHAHLEAQDFESRAFKCRDYVSGGDLNTETGEIPPDRGNHATRVTRSARMHPGIPRRVRCVTRHLASAPVCGRVIAKEGADRSLRDRGKRRPGKQPGEPGTTMNLAADPDERFAFPPAASCGCGAGLAGAPVLAQRRHQVTDIAPAPAPRVTEYVAQAKEWPGCGMVTAGELPAYVRARASFGPETCAQAANLTAGHHIPVYRSTLLLCQLAGIAVSTAWMAGIRGRAASLVEASGFMDRVREVLKTAPAVHADETPARAAGGTRYVHLACTRYLTCMHTGDRSADAIDARRIARRFLGFEDLILRFATRPDLDIFSNNEAERTIRPVKVQQRSSGGCWRTIDGLADFALVQSYLSTAAKWGISKLDTLRDLFNCRAWLPPGLEPAGLRGQRGSPARLPVTCAPWHHLHQAGQPDGPRRAAAADRRGLRPGAPLALAAGRRPGQHDAGPGGPHRPGAGVPAGAELFHRGRAGRGLRRHPRGRQPDAAARLHETRSPRPARRVPRARPAAKADRAAALEHPPGHPGRGDARPLRRGRRFRRRPAAAGHHTQVCTRQVCTADPIAARAIR